MIRRRRTFWEIDMNTRILAAALVAPMIALGPATAWAHHCSRSHHHHHARGVDKEKYGSSRQMRNNSGSSTNQDLNQGTGAGQNPGATDQGTGSSSGSSSSGGRRQGI
jgi:hypothetical protein